MKWNEITKIYPNRLVLVEALKATSQNRIRIIEEMSVVNEYKDSMEAWEGYKQYHKDDPGRELYIFHTSRENVEVVEEFFSGVRQH
ncbi:hypothetical protein RAC89_18205 [Paenibacillus sp. GD4]|jgi:hypothetical protein|uniref:hypothetical protein n=1 Tax=Paenibacillus sp. GD4 TaxID=3068890 RepID=UPI00279642A6|nr:hypothetical protein [Paenibacillus sp. GD4]MDQ1912325.1 hypothetical protein [Paenibacillus sp. GD4]